MRRKFYHRTIEGTLKPQHEEEFRQLGVKYDPLESCIYIRDL